MQSRLEAIDSTFAFPVWCYLYQIRNQQTTDDILIKIFDQAYKDSISVMDYENSSSFVNRNPIKQIINHTEESCAIKIIFEVFKYKSHPSFFKVNKPQETKHWYLLIINIGQYIFIQKSWWTKSIDQVFFRELKKEGIMLSSITKQQNNCIIQSKWYTNLVTLDLKNTKKNKNSFEKMRLSWIDLTLATNKSDVWNFKNSSMKVKNEDTWLNINYNTSKLQFTWEKEVSASFKNLLRFYHSLQICLNNPLGTNQNAKKLIDFTESAFAMPYQFWEWEVFNPSCISFDIWEIEQKLKEQIEEDWERFAQYVDCLDNLYDFFAITSQNDKYEFSLRIWDENIKVEVKDNNVVCDDNGIRDLVEIINNNNLYTIYWKVWDKEVTYNNGEFYEVRCFEEINRNIIINSVKWIFSSTTNSEKWLNNNWDWFSENSLFGQLEIFYQRAENRPKWLLCWDMGYEIADYVSITEDEIIFIHAKSHDETNNTKSVTVFHEVVSQAIKNIWFITWEDWNLNILKNTSWKVTVNWLEIDKLRLWSLDTEDIKKHLELVFRKKIILAVNFFEAQRFIDYLQNSDLGFLKTQLINLLGELISTCKSRWIILEVWCKTS